MAKALIYETSLLPKIDYLVIGLLRTQSMYRIMKQQTNSK